MSTHTVTKPPFVAFSADRKSWTYHGTAEAARRHVGPEGTVEVPTDEFYEAHLRKLGIIPPESDHSAPQPSWTTTAHGCHHRHRTHRALAKCGWPRAWSVTGEGAWVLYLEGEHYYEITEHGGGRPAVWPVITLYPSYEALNEAYQRIDYADYRRVGVYVFPDDPRDAQDYEGRTLEGIRAKYARAA